MANSRTFFNKILPIFLVIITLIESVPLTRYLKPETSEQLVDFKDLLNPQSDVRKHSENSENNNYEDYLVKFLEVYYQENVMGNEKDSLFEKRLKDFNKNYDIVKKDNLSKDNNSHLKIDNYDNLKRENLDALKNLKTDNLKTIDSKKVDGDFASILGEDHYPDMEEMQGDQPEVERNSIDLELISGSDNDMEENSTGITDEYLRTMKNRNRDSETEERAKDSWIKLLKHNILMQMGRVNSTAPKRPDMADIFSINRENNSAITESFFTEKTRSYYPICDLPKGTDTELWNDQNTLNLHYNFDLTESTIQTASLRLYRVQNNSSEIRSTGFRSSAGSLPVPSNTADGLPADCDSSSMTPVSDDEKVIRVTVYWYIKPLKKHKPLRRRVCDSRVISEHTHWIELNVKSAALNWAKGHNAGLAVTVEDQDGVVLKADEYFEGPVCTIDAPSTPKPIPNIILDTLRHQSTAVNTDSSSSASSVDAHPRLLSKDTATALTLHTALRLPSLDVTTTTETSHSQQQQEYYNSISSNSYDSHNDNNHNDNNHNDNNNGNSDNDNGNNDNMHLSTTDCPSVVLQSVESVSRHTRHHRHHQEQEEQQHHHDSDDPRSRMVATEIIWTNQQLMDMRERLGARKQDDSEVDSVR